MLLHSLQPLGSCSAQGSSSGTPSAFFSSMVASLVLSLLHSHSLLTSRCAMIPTSESESRYGSTPISIRRDTEEAVLLVCSVLTTRCPVIEAFTAISAVSESRISPIIMISGSCRRMERSALTNVRSALLFTIT